jgi:hypothetical protein
VHQPDSGAIVITRGERAACVDDNPLPAETVVTEEHHGGAALPARRRSVVTDGMSSPTREPSDLINLS